ncbi:MAG: YcgN family cysteine cluster protein [Pseudomonadota bacterium]
MHWYDKPLESLSESEWEALCDGCGQCCLNQLLDEQDHLYQTDVACRLLNTDNALCCDYENRSQRVPECVRLTPDNLQQVYFMPPTCAYRLRANGQRLPDWHPLRHDGNKDAMKKAGIHVAGRCISERQFSGDLENRIVTWPLSSAAQ